MKLRVRYAKQGKVRFVGNLDVTRIWERSLRKAAVPVAYSTGFSPRPRLSFGLALPMAAESIAEYLDIEAAEPVPLDGLADRLTDSLPAGFTALVAAEKPLGAVSLQEDVVASDWELTLCGVSAGRIAEAVESVLAADSLPVERERKGERRVDDLRPAIESLALVDRESEGVVVAVRLATVGRGVRPTELVGLLVADGDDAPEVGDLVRGVLRTEQWIERDGARRELLPLPAAVAASALVAGAGEGT